jgi:hypothetical protein
MLFFFELFLFVLVLMTLAIGEFVSRGLALGLWLVVTAFAVVGYVLARGSLASLAAGEVGAETAPAEPPGHAAGSIDKAEPAPEVGPAEGPTPLDARWARTMLYNWRRANALLLFGALAVGGWYWLGG